MLQATIAMRRRYILLLFAIPFIVYLLSGPTFLGYDGGIMLRVTESLVLHHSFRITDPIYHFDEPYAIYGLAVSLLLVPFYLAGQLIGNPDLVVNLFEPGVTALTVVALAFLLVELGRPWTTTAWVTLLYAFGSLAWQYSGVLFAEPLIGLCLTLALLWAVRFRRDAKRRWLVAAGAAAGVAVVARLDCALDVALPVGLYLLATTRRRGRLGAWAGDAGAFAVPVLGALVSDAAYNALRFGSPLRTGYPVDTLGFSTPLLKGLYGLLLSPGVGLVVFMPIVLASLAGWPGFVRSRRAEAVLVAALVLIRLAVFARWWAWDGGASWGPRYLVPVVPLLMLPLAFIRMRRRARGDAAETRMVWPAGVGVVLLGFVSVAIEVLAQLVWYGTYYRAVFPGLLREVVARDHVTACQSCGLAAMVSVEAVKDLMDFRWQDSPLYGQFQLLLSGGAHPAWMPIAPLLPVAGLGLVAALAFLFRLARRLDASMAIEPHGLAA